MGSSALIIAVDLTMLALTVHAAFRTRELLHRCVNQMPGLDTFQSGKISSLCVPGRKRKKRFTVVATWCRDTASAVHSRCAVFRALDNPFIGCYQPEHYPYQCHLPAPFGPSKVKIFPGLSSSTHQRGRGVGQKKPRHFPGKPTCHVNFSLAVVMKCYNITLPYSLR